MSNTGANKKKTNNMEIDSNDTALLEEEIKKLQAQNDHLVSTYGSELQKQVQQQVQQQVQLEKDKLAQKYDEEVKAAKQKCLLERRNPHDFIQVEEDEKKKAVDISTRFNKLLKEVEAFSVLPSKEYGMQHDNEFLPEQTSDNGLIEIKKNIAAKVKEHHRVFDLCASKIRKLLPDYSDTQKLRHRKIKYKKKHSAATRRKNKKKEDKQVSLQALYSYEDVEGPNVDSDNDRADLR